MRVYVATTWAGVAAVVREGVPAGTEGFAMTHRLAQAMGAPAPMAASDEVLDELVEVTLAAAADASLLMLAEAEAEVEVEVEAAARGVTVARRAVLALEVEAGAVRGPDGAPDEVHPAAVVLPDGAPAAAVLSVLADDERDADVLVRAVALLRGAAGGPDEPAALEAALALLAEHALGWFDPTEVR